MCVFKHKWEEHNDASTLMFVVLRQYTLLYTVKRRRKRSLLSLLCSCVLLRPSLGPGPRWHTPFFTRTQPSHGKRQHLGKGSLPKNWQNEWHPLSLKRSVSTTCMNSLFAMLFVALRIDFYPCYLEFNSSYIHREL